jgi:Na+/H+ antiporter NhaC
MIGSIFALIPIAATLFVAFKWKNVFLALLTGLLLSGVILLIDTGTLLPVFEAIPNTLASSSFVKTVLFLFLTGAIMNVVNKSGGVEGLIIYFTEKKKIVKTRLGAQLISFVLGLILFVDGTSSIVVTALVGKPFFHKYGVANEKLALISNSTGSAIAWIIPFGGAGAFMTSLVTSVFVDLGITDNPFALIISSAFFQFYGLALILVVLLAIIFDIKTKETESSIKEKSKDFIYETEILEGKKSLARNIIFPLILLIVTIFILLLLTGNGSLASGDGGTSVFVAGTITIIVSGIYYMIQGLVKLETYIEWCFEGMKSLFELIVILILATAFASLTNQLGVATYFASLASGVSGNAIVLVALIISLLISYSTGSSGASVALLFPVILPIAYQIGVPFEYVIGAIVSGAVFGDQNSPISDSIILTTTVTDVKIMDQVRTQLPFTLTALGLTTVAFIILSILG